MRKVIDVVRNSGPLTGLSDQDAAVIRFGRQLFTDKKVDSRHVRESRRAVRSARCDGYRRRDEHLRGQRLLRHRRR